jgi:hypothetical protein
MADESQNRLTDSASGRNVIDLAREEMARLKTEIAYLNGRLETHPKLSEELNGRVRALAKTRGVTFESMLDEVVRQGLRPWEKLWSGEAPEAPSPGKPARPTGG